jgi:hypothetical protein
MARTAKDGLMMAKKSVVSYAGLALGTDQEKAESVRTPEAMALPERSSGTLEGRTLKESSAHLMLYLHPAAAKALKRYALDQNVKVHDLLIEAVEEWFRTHGLKEQVRAETVRQKPKAKR